MSSVDTITISFKLLTAKLLVQTLINCNVKVNVSPLKLTFSLLFSKKNVIVFKTDLFTFYDELFQAHKTLYNHLVDPKQN